MKQIKNIYDHLPAPLGNLAFSAAGANIQRTRYGRGFHEMLAEFESHEGWPAERVAEWRDARLRKLICHAYRTVPYYHDLMDEGGVDPASIKGIDDLEMLPTLTKDMVKSAPERFVSSEASSMNLMHVHTSGTTGSGFRFLSTVECQQAQFACFWRYYRKHGIDIGTWQAQFSSRQAVPKRVSTPPFWRIDYPGRRYYMSAFHESPANLRYYYEVIQENRFEWISGYPSLMVLLAQWMNERDLRFDFIRAVTCGAENLLDHQADAMERAFGVRPVQTYGQTENVAIFSQQPDRRILVDEDFSAVEFLPTANNAGGGDTRGGRDLSIQLCHASHQIPDERHRHARRHVGAKARDRLARWAAGGLYLSAGRHARRKTRSRVQGHAAFPGGPNLSAEGLFGCLAGRGGAVYVRRGREDGARGVPGIYWRLDPGRIRISALDRSQRLREASVCCVGGREQ